MKTHGFTVGLVSATLLATGLAIAQPGGTAPNNAPTQSQMHEMDQHMQRMNDLHQKLQAATKPEERQRLMAEQRAEMQAGMSMMQGMRSSSAMPSHQGVGMGGQAGMGMDANQAAMMQKRMDMMTEMMQSMMDQQGMGMMRPDGASTK